MNLNKDKKRLVVNTSIGLTPNIVRGGNAIAEGNGIFRINQFNKHKTDDVYIGDKLAVDDKEKLMIDGNNIKVLSEDLKVKGLSPVGISDMLVRKGFPNDIAFNIAFNEQEKYKDRNGINTDDVNNGKYGFVKFIENLFKPNKQKDVKEDIKEDTKKEKVYNLDMNELAARQLFMESEFKNNAKSNKNARGYFQIRQPALDEYNKENKTNYTLDDMHDMNNNFAVRNWYMNYQGQRGPAINENNNEINRIVKMFAGYNMGSFALGDYLVEQKNNGVDIYNSLDWVDGLPEETKNYVKFIVLGEDINKYKNNKRYNQSIVDNDEIYKQIKTKLNNGGVINMSITPNINKSLPKGGKIKASAGKYIADWAAPAINIVGQGISYALNKKYLNEQEKLIKSRKRLDIQPVKLKTDFNITPQLSEINKNEAAINKMISENTVSSQSLLNRLANIRQSSILAKNKLQGEKENIETGLINQDRLNKQNILQLNTSRQDDLENQKYAALMGVTDKRSENAINLTQGIASAINQGIAFNRQRNADKTTLFTTLVKNPDILKGYILSQNPGLKYKNENGEVTEAYNVALDSFYKKFFKRYNLNL